MNTDQPPSPQEWKALYEATIEFKKAAPWDWMDDIDIFGVQDPVSGETGYCCIMGAAGEHYALGVYLGAEGLEGIMRIVSGDISPYDGEALFIQRCLMASFEDRKYLQKEDLQQIKALGLRFRGNNAWPMFRNYTPGLVPWFLTGKEAVFLTLALQQAVEVSRRFQKDPDMLNHSPGEQYLVRVPLQQGVNILWKDEWIEPIFPERNDFPVMTLDETILERLKKVKFQQKGVWEVDFFYVPTPIKEKEERPYYPYMCIMVEHRSAFVFYFQIEKKEEFTSKFPSKFVSFLEGAKIKPKEFLVKRDEVYASLEPFAAMLGSKIKMVESLPILEDARRSMREFI